MRRTSGSMLVLTLVLVSLLVIVVAFFAINYSQFVGTQKEAQTAIDAAALRAASDIGRVVISGNFGAVSLVDDSPPTSGGGNFQKRNVIGINTLLGTLRLDMIIADKLGNKVMLNTAKSEIALAQKDADALTKAIQDALSGSGTVTDKNGTTIDLVQDAIDAYNNNNRRMGNTNKQLVAGSMKISAGELSAGNGQTNIPTPQPASDDPPTNAGGGTNNFVAHGFYKPYVAIPCPSNTTVTFCASGPAPALVPNNTFTSTIDSGIAPAVVQVTAQEQVVGFGANTGYNTGRPAAAVQVTATAQAGGQRFNFPSGGFYLSFPDGFPVGSTVDFTSVQSMINSPGWLSGGTYSVNQGGGSFSAQPYLGQQGVKTGDALATMTYNWLFSLDLRPNIEAAVKAFQVPLKAFADSNQAGATQTITAMTNPNSFVVADAAPRTGSAVLVPYASTKDPQTGKDVREIADNNRPALNNRFLECVVQEGTQPTSLFKNTALLTLNPDGKLAAPDTLAIKEQISKDNELAGHAHMAAATVIKNHVEKAHSLFMKLANHDPALIRKSSVGGKGGEQVMDKALEQIVANNASLEPLKSEFDGEVAILKRAHHVRANSLRIAQVSSWMLGNYTQLSSPSNKVITPGKLSNLTGLLVHHLASAPQASDIENGVNLATGLNAAWTDDVVPYVSGQTIDILADNHADNSLAMPPALAQGAIPAPDIYQFYYTAIGASDAPAGTFSIMLSLAPFGTASLPSVLQGQLFYQCTDAVRTDFDFKEYSVYYGYATFPKQIYLDWQGIAWNQNAFCSTNTQYYNTEQLPASTTQNGQIRPVVEFWLRCPIARCYPGVVIHEEFHYEAGPGYYDFQLAYGNFVYGAYFFGDLYGSDIFFQIDHEMNMILQGGCPTTVDFIT
jgi:hypothetical protein